MLTLRGHGNAQSERGERPRRARAAAASVVLHLVVFAGLWQALQFPRAIANLFYPSSREQQAPERLRFFTVAPPRAVQAPATARAPRQPLPATAVPGGPQPSVSGPSAPPPPFVAPTQVPSTLPPAGGTPRIDGPSSGPLVSGRGPLRGVQPGYTEPRIWIEPQVVTGPALEGDAKLDSAVTSLISAFNDSMVRNTYQPNRFERGDWTYTTRDGKKYGIDQQFIRLGKVSIPTALLGLLPLNQTGNPGEYDRQRRLDQMRSEILAQAAQAMNEEEFRRAVKQIRDRKERERRDAEKKKKKEEVKVISDR